MDLDTIVDGYYQESAVDCVGLWEIAQTAREELGATTREETRDTSLAIVKKLYKKGLRPGDYSGREVTFWPDNGRQAMLDRIEQAWIELGADPNPTQPICWFARPKS